MSRRQYVLVAAGATVELPDGRMAPTVVPGQLVVVKPSSQAYYRGAPVPQVLPASVHKHDPTKGTLLGVLMRPPVPSGANFGTPLAVLTIAIQGGADLLESDYDALRAAPLQARSGWTNYMQRRILTLPPPATRIVLG